MRDWLERGMQGNVRERLKAGYVSDLGSEEQSVVGMLESPVADLERPGMLEGLVVDLECPLQSGPVWGGMENDSKENVLEWTVDDFGEKFIDEVVEAKRFKQVRAWGDVHMSQSSQERPGEQHGDKDIGHTDDKDHVVNDRRHTERGNVKQSGETSVDAIRREIEAVGYSM